MKFILPVLVTLFAFALAAPSEEGQAAEKCYDSGCKPPPSPLSPPLPRKEAAVLMAWGIHTLTSDAYVDACNSKSQCCSKNWKKYDGYVCS